MQKLYVAKKKKNHCWINNNILYTRNFTALTFQHANYKYSQGNFSDGVYIPSVNDIFDDTFLMSIVGRLTEYFTS